jgi:hypothetical protein
MHSVVVDEPSGYEVRDEAETDGASDATPDASVMTRHRAENCEWHREDEPNDEELSRQLGVILHLVAGMFIA